MDTTTHPAARTPSDLYPTLAYDDALAAIEFLERAFGFRRRMIVPGPDGSVRHSELSFGTGVVMVYTSRPAEGRRSPRSLGGHNGGLCVQVDDPDAHYQRAMAGGAVIVQELRDEEYGTRGYMASDPEGHVWYFGTYRPGAYWDAEVSKS
jgi:uncharacterized glyoxalase superfamily protein PhnB